MGKQVFNIIVHTGDTSKGKNGFITYHKVNSVDKFKSFVNDKYPLWKFATIYDKETRSKIEVIKP